MKNFVSCGTVIMGAQIKLKTFEIFRNAKGSLDSRVVPKKYSSLIVDLMSAAVPGTYGVTNFSSNDSSYVFRLFCNMSRVRKDAENAEVKCRMSFRLSCRKSDVLNAGPLSFEVQAEEAEHQHAFNALPVPIRLSGYRRNEIKKALMTKPISKLRESMTLKASDVQLKAGRSELPTTAALKKTKTELLQVLDYDKDPIIDMKKRCLDPYSSISRVTITEDNFTAIMGTFEQLEVLAKVNSNNHEEKIIRLSIDATGSILHELMGKKVLHHSLVMPVTVAIDEKQTIITLKEMITTNQKANNIAGFLTDFVDHYKELDPVNKICDEIVTDKSFANIGAILQVFNQQTITQYLDACYKVLVLNQDDVWSNNYVVIRLCSSHTTKNMLDELRKNFFGENLNKMCRFIGPIFNFKTFHEAHAYISAFIVILSCKNINDENYEDASEVVNAVHEGFDLDWELDLQNIIVPDVTAELMHDTSNAIYRKSCFYKEFKCMASSLHSHEIPLDEITNPFYCPDFLDYFVKQQLAYLPLWSHLMTAIKFPDAPRGNNVIVELSFRDKKKNIRESSTRVGKFGTIKPGRYVSVQEKANAAAVKRFLLELPSRSRTQERRKLSTSNHCSEPRNSSHAQPRVLIYDSDDSIDESGVMESQEHYSKPHPPPIKKTKLGFF